MSLRIRKDGRILCAAMHPEEPGDTYIDDSLHHILSVDRKVLVTEPHERHRYRGEWWWAGSVPEGIEVDEFYLTGSQRNWLVESLRATKDITTQPAWSHGKSSIALPAH